MIKVSPEDAPLLAAHRWQVNRNGYLVRYVQANYVRSAIILHRVITGAGPGLVVDHINGDKLDNRRENLRVCRHADNMKNCRLHKNNKVGLKGVYRCRDKFRAEIKVDGVKHALGSYACVGDAKRAYDAASLKFHGEFGRTA